VKAPVKKSFLILSFILLFVASCKNDLELNAPYKEIPSIYAVLNPYESLQMIRVNKVFLGEGNAYDMAKVSDSVNYQPGELTVSLKHSTGSTLLFRDSVIQTAEGAFNTSQRVYVSGEKIATSGSYTLTVKNNTTGKFFTASCQAIDRVPQNQGYKPLQPPYYKYPAGTAATDYVDYKTADGSIRFALLPSEVQIYQLVIRNHYYNDYGSYKVNEYVDYSFGNRYPKDAVDFSFGKWIVTTFKRNDYFSAVGVGMSKKSQDPAIKGRKMWMIEYLIYASTQEYLDYLEYAKPPLGFNQNKPLYSNFANGDALGLFTMRTTCSVQKEMASVMISEFATNPNTCNYRFYDFNDNLQGCK
jgi:hypothetical protein